ncbi:hypothetical protein HanXRQr2_Chr09g0381091 [Helianthus annuus]|uniref:Uncharacterized protein n=1 Tax=Helianthus annuus TaxID=4232 RepID=A0A9K3I5A5_HELAN|nr:hypothetical protein HanXRQr2_Chr09g0381091 [Helianthus annuus]KAJ0541884.1 hypothetical protein HanHA89_Chr09g0333641 [Helianthus annuus]KAJ0892554.1 hypothetical protein HanPSC8_Chr09g0367251 [Helianthus annuus]
MVIWGGATCSGGGSYFLSVFICACDEYNLLSDKPLVNSIGGNGGIGTAHVRRGIDVIKRGGEDKWILARSAAASAV